MSSNAYFNLSADRLECASCCTPMEEMETFYGVYGICPKCGAVVSQAEAWEEYYEALASWQEYEAGWQVAPSSTPVVSDGWIDLGYTGKLRSKAPELLGTQGMHPIVKWLLS